MTIIYADLTFLLNGGMDYLIFCCVMRLSGLPVQHLRVLAASALGGLYAIFAAIPTYDFLTAFLAKCMVSLLMGRIVFGRNRYFLRYYLLFLAVSCTLSGASVGAAAMLRQTDSPWIIFFAAALFCAFTLSVVFHRAGSVLQTAELLEATITCGGRQITVPLLLDTGNTLRDPLTGRVMCVVWQKALEPLKRQPEHRVFFQSLGQSRGELAYFYCDSIAVDGEIWYDYPIGVAHHPLSDGGGYVGLWGGEKKGEEGHVAKTA